MDKIYLKMEKYFLSFLGRVFLIVSVFLFLFFNKANAIIQFQPYMGFGVGTLSYGNKTIIDGSVQGYLLGFKGGFEFNNNFSIFIDYSRTGPLDYYSQSSISELSTSKLVFNVFSGGIGLQINSHNFNLWMGYYPYDRFIEYSRDFRFKGSLQRIGLGMALNPAYKVHFYYDIHNFQGDSLTDSAKSLLCGINSTSICSDSGSMHQVSFIISSAF